MRVLVTGGHGFIGSHVCARLRFLGHDVLVLDRRSGPDTYFGDIRDATLVTDAVAHADAVIHLAGVLGTAETVDNPRPSVETNIVGALNVFQAVRQYGVPAVNIAVGNWWFDNAYSITKNCAERLAFMFNAEHGTRIAVVRAMNAYGPGQVPATPFGPSKVRKIMPAFICRALTGLPVEVYGDGTQIMDMVHVRDVAAELVWALHGDAVLDRAIECGTGRPTTVNEIAQQVIDAVGSGTIRHVPMRPGEKPGETVLANPENSHPKTGRWTPLEEGVVETVEWYRENWLPTWQS